MQAQINRLTKGIYNNQIAKFEKWYSDWKDYNQRSLTPDQFDIYKKENHDDIYTPNDADADSDAMEDMQINQNIKSENASEKATPSQPKESDIRKNTEDDFGIDDL